MSKWMLLCLLALFESTHLKKQTKEEKTNFNQEKSEMIRDILTKGLKDHAGCHPARQRRDFRYLYFHMEYHSWSVFAFGLRVPISQCFVANTIENDLFGGRISLNLTFPAVSVLGSLRCNNAPSHSVSLNINMESYDCEMKFRMLNVTGHGMCFTKWTERNYQITDCDLHFDKPKLDSIRLNVFECDRNEEELNRVIRSEYFKKVMLEKLWRGLLNHMNSNVKDTINDLLNSKNVIAFLKDPVVFQKYQAYVIESTASANEFVDSIMGGVKKGLTEKYHDKVKIPDINERFSRKGIFVTWRGSFTANQGTVRGLVTVERSGDTSFANDNASQTHFFGNLTFDHLDLHYDHYKAEFMNIGPVGTLSTILRPIRLHIHPYVNFETNKVYLEDFRIEEVGELVVEVTGLGTILNWLVSKITTWIVGMTRDKILDDLQNKYDKYIKSILSGYTVDDLINGKAFDKNPK